jgi:hypothetical protein
MTILKTNTKTMTFSHPCIICFEPLSYMEYTNIQQGLILLDRIFEKDCRCKVYAHNFCIMKWYKHRLLCPYCKTKVLYHRPSQVLLNHLIWFSHKCMTCMTIYTCIETCIYLFENQVDSYVFHALTSSTVCDYDYHHGIFDTFGNNSTQLKIE